MYEMARWNASELLHDAFFGSKAVPVCVRGVLFDSEKIPDASTDLFY